MPPFFLLRTAYERDKAQNMSKTEEKPEKVLPKYQDIEISPTSTFRVAAAFSKDAFLSALKYKPRPDDLFIVTYPKCGTTWVQNIVACIYRNGVPFPTAMEFLSSTPFLEMTGVEAAETMPRPGAIKLHLPFHLTPYSFKAKYIFVARNPKDCCVSFYYHTKNPLYGFSEGSFDDYFELFIDGKVDFGDYFDTLLSWYKHRNDPNVLFITYEELKKDIEKNVLRIAAFMDEQYKEALETDPKFLKDVIHYSSFSYMKEFLNKQMEEMCSLPPEMILNNPDIPPAIKNLFQQSKGETFAKPSEDWKFVRKGIVGDWRNHFSEEQNRRMESKFHEKTEGIDLENFWKEEMVFKL